MKYSPKLSPLITKGKPLRSLKIWEVKPKINMEENDLDTSVDVTDYFPKVDMGTPSLDTTEDNDSKSSRTSSASKRRRNRNPLSVKKIHTPKQQISAMERSLQATYEDGQMLSYSSPGSDISVGSKKRLAFSPKKGGSPRIHNKENVKRSSPRYPSPLVSLHAASPSSEKVSKDNKTWIQSPRLTEEILKDKSVVNHPECESDLESSSETEEDHGKIPSPTKHRKSPSPLNKTKTKKMNSSRSKNVINDNKSMNSKKEVDSELTQNVARTRKSQERSIGKSTKQSPPADTKQSNSRSTKYRSMEIQAGRSKIKSRTGSRKVEKTCKQVEQGSFNRSTRLTRSSTVGSKDEPIGLFVHKLNLSLQNNGVVNEKDLFSISHRNKNTRHQLQQSSLNEPDFHISRGSSVSKPSVNKTHKSLVKELCQSQVKQTQKSPVEKIQKSSVKEIRKSPVKTSRSLVVNYTTEVEDEGCNRINHTTRTVKRSRKKRPRLTMPRQSQQNKSKNISKVMDQNKNQHQEKKGKKPRKSPVKASRPLVNYTAAEEEVDVNRTNNSTKTTKKISPQKSRKRRHELEKDDYEEEEEEDVGDECEQTVAPKQRKTRQQEKQPTLSSTRKLGVSFARTEKDYKADQELIYSEELEDDFEPTGWIGLQKPQKKAGMSKETRENVETINAHSVDSRCFLKNEDKNLQTGPRVPVHVNVKRDNNTVEKCDIFRSVTDLKWSAPNKKRPKGKGLSYHKYFNNKDGVTMGQMKLEGNGEKGKQKCNKCGYFQVLKGNLEVIVNSKEFHVISGDAFNVPLGSSYNIRNIARYEARLLYFLTDE